MNIEKQMPELKPNNGQMPMELPSAQLAANPMLSDAKIKTMLFRPEMVTALLDGTKIQTRRIIDIDSKYDFMGFEIGNSYRMPNHIGFGSKKDCEIIDLVKQKIFIGDIIWVRESANIVGINGITGFHFSGQKPVGYRSVSEITIEYEADKLRVSLPYPNRLSLNVKCGKKLAYGIFKEAARIFLQVTDVRVERLQDISETDAVDEGVLDMFHNQNIDGNAYFDYMDKKGGWDCVANDAIHSYQTLWTKINGQGSWEKNPYVWVYTFKIVECPLGFR